MHAQRAYKLVLQYTVQRVCGPPSLGEEVVFRNLAASTSLGELQMIAALLSVVVGSAGDDACSLAAERVRHSLSGQLATHARDDEFVYLDNGVVRVGIDLTRGGSIGFLADAHTPTTNLINTHDMGREVQLSYYSGPSFYNPPTAEYPAGACNRLFRGQEWPWNPIGAGDVDGNHGDILNLTHDGTSAHVLTRPLQWACHHVACDCTFEQTFSLHTPAGTGVRVDTVRLLPLCTSCNTSYRLLLSDSHCLPASDAGAPHGAH
jgi:hypothetical protein